MARIRISGTDKHNKILARAVLRSHVTDSEAYLYHIFKIKHSLRQSHRIHCPSILLRKSEQHNLYSRLLPVRISRKKLINMSKALIFNLQRSLRLVTLGNHGLYHIHISCRINPLQIGRGSFSHAKVIFPILFHLSQGFTGLPIE